MALCLVARTMGVSGALNEFSETAKIGLRQCQIIRYNAILEFHPLNAETETPYKSIGPWKLHAKYSLYRNNMLDERFQLVLKHQFIKI